MNQRTSRGETRAAARREAERIEAMLAASLDLAAKLEPGDVYRALVSHAIDLVDGDAGRLYLQDPEHGRLRQVASVGTNDSDRDDPSGPSGELLSRIRDREKPLVLETFQDGGSSSPRAIAAVPIRHDGRVLGLLEVTADAPGTFHDSNIPLLTHLADQAAVAVRNARRYQAVESRAETLAIKTRIAAAAGKTLDLDHLTEVVYREVEAAFELDAFFLALSDEDTDQLSYRFQIDGGRRIPAEGKALGRGLTASVIGEGEPLLIRDFEQEREDLPLAELWGTMKTPASWLGVPMQVGDRTIGVISIQAYRPQAYGEPEQELLTTIAQQVAVGVENARLYEETSQRLAQTQVLRELMFAAASTLDFDLVLERTLRALHATLGVERVGFAMPDPDGQSLSLHASQIGFPEEVERIVLGLDDSVCGRVSLTGEPMVIDDVRTSSCYYPGVPDTLSELAVPVRVPGRLNAVLNVESSQVNDFNDKDLDFYTTIANQLSVALENARLFQAERKQRQQTEALEEAAAIVSGTLDLDQVLDRILEQVEKVVTGDAFNVMLIEGEGEARVVRRRGYDQQEASVQSLSVGEFPLLLGMIETGEPTVVPNTAIDPHWVLREGQEPWQGYVGAPIKVGNLVVGFLNVNTRGPGAFDRRDARRLEAFANHAATAIENARLYQELYTYADSLEELVKERTAQLRAQYAQLETILDSATDGIILAGSDGELVLANPVARDWLRHELSPRESDQLAEAVRTLAMQAETRPEMILELAGLDLQLTAAPVRKPAAEDARAVVAIHDISHLKTLNRMKSRFVSNVSHELRTPIATIKLLAHLMQQQPESWTEYLEPLIREAEHQAALVRDILEMSRVDAGRLEIHAEPTGLNQLVEMAAEKYENRAEDRHLRLTCRPADPDPIALVDPHWMMQVLNNLLSNALRYTPPGGSITVATGSDVADGRSWATVNVADTGIGIPVDELPHIFDRFFRGEKPRAMQMSGTGLGLAILKEIVELHGGHVAVESVVDEGSSFTVWLPQSPR